MISDLKRKTNQTGRALRKQAGFSLVELLIAITIFMIVTGSIYGLLALGRMDRNRSSRRADMLKNARVAVHMIGRDVLNAGLGYHRRGAIVPDNFNSTRFGVPADVDSQRDMLTSVIVGNNTTANNLNPVVGARTDQITFAYRDVNFNCGNGVDLQSVAAPGGAPTVARLTPRPGSIAAAGPCPAPRTDQASRPSPFDVFLVESNTTQIAIVATAVNGGMTAIDAAPGDPLGLNQPLNGTGIGGSMLRQCTGPTDTNCTTYTATARRVFLVTYRVNADGTLVRILYGNNRGAAAAAQIQEQPMAYNVEDFQIRYILEDGTTSDNPSVGPDGIVGTIDDDWQGFNRVRQLTITVRIQALDSDLQNGRPETITFTSTFSTRNLEYDAA